MQNRPYILALIGQVLFGFTLYGRNADVLYYFTYVEEMQLIIQHIPCALLSRRSLEQHVSSQYSVNLTTMGRTASVFALLTGISMLSMYFFNVKKCSHFLCTGRSDTILLFWI